jgi:hypothetical protein
MAAHTQQQRATLTDATGTLLVAAMIVLLPGSGAAQGLTGSLIGAVRDEQGAAVPGAAVRISSPALIGGAATTSTNEKGQLRLLALSPGVYVLDIAAQGFTSVHEDNIRIGAGSTIERNVTMRVAEIAQSVVVAGTGSRIDARDPGLGARFGSDDLSTIPARRASMFDWIKAAPGVSPTSPSSATINTLSVFGSGVNENQFLVDGTNFTCPCSGVARSEPGVDFIQEVHVQSIGASAEFGNVQGGVINVITRQGGERYLYDASYYGQPAAITSQPRRLPIRGMNRESGYERDRYRDFTTNLGGPLVRERLWFFTGYQYFRDYDSQPGTDPEYPRTYEQNKVFGKLTWRLAPGWQLLQSMHYEHWVNPDLPTLSTPFDATVRRSASVPAITFGHLTHTFANTVWDVRVGRFVYDQETQPSSGDLTRPGRTDSVTGVASGAPQVFGAPRIIRTSGKATLSHYRPALFGGDHEWKIGLQVERGEHHVINIIPSGVRFVDNNGQPSQAISSDPSHVGGAFFTTGIFASDSLALGDRMTINLGVRFDHSRAISQDLHAIDLQGNETAEIIGGLGTLYTWNLISPRLGLTLKLSADGRTILRSSYGRFNQGMLTGEFEPFHPGASPITTADYVPATGDYSRIRSVVNTRLNLRLDRETQAPHTDEYSVGIDREIGRQLAVSVAYVGKKGDDFIGWTDVGGQYVEEARTLADGRTVPVFNLTNATADRRFLLSNAEGYSLTYNGVAAVIEKRRSNGWQMFGSYTYSHTYGLIASNAISAAGAQISTVSPPQPLTFGRDPNDLTNARGRLANDRPHMFRTMGSVDVPRTGLAIAANLQHLSGKPWAASAVIPLAQSLQQRILLEPRGTRRLPSQTLLDVRISRAIGLGEGRRVELLLDLLNLLDDAAEESLASETLMTGTTFSATFGQPVSFMDPRRVMLGVRLNLGR